MIRSDGSDNRLILDEAPYYQQGFVLLQEIRFAPDGRQLALAINREVFLLSVEGGPVRQLTHTDGNAIEPAWSPDGRFIIYSRPFFRSAELDSSGLYVIDISSYQERALLHEGRSIAGFNPRWSPSGEPIAFASRSPGYAYPDIYIVRSDGAEFRRLTFSDDTRAWSERPHWINQGKRLLFAWRLRHSAASFETRVMADDGSNQSTWPLTLSLLTLASDAISPDAQDVIVPALPPNDTHSLAVLFVRRLNDASGSTLRQLTTYQPTSESPVRQTSTDDRSK